MVEVTRWEAPHTNGQLAHLHAIIQDFSIHTHRHPEVEKAYAKDFLGYYETLQRKDGTTLLRQLSFAKASKSQMSEFIERLIQHAMEFGVTLRDGVEE